jgi:ubiquinone/menaquinone biosynthesis C-methylase UbiE
MTSDGWKQALAAFFSERADQVDSAPTLRDLCYIAGRDPRLWTDHEIYHDLIASIVAALDVDFQSTVLEVGCASGFLARGIAPVVGAYTGIDVSQPALAVARRLHLPNATFRAADGSRLSVPDGAFDAALCYDVFTNFPTFAVGASIIREMLRVVKPGGRVLIGSIPDEATRDAYERRAAEVGAELTSRFGPPPPPPVGKATLGKRVRHLFRTPVEPQIVCYYFHRRDFETLGAQLGCAVEITDIHPRNPYTGYRFNVTYTRTS